LILARISLCCHSEYELFVCVEIFSDSLTDSNAGSFDDALRPDSMTDSNVSRDSKRALFQNQHVYVRYLPLGPHGLSRNDLYELKVVSTTIIFRTILYAEQASPADI